MKIPTVRETINLFKNRHNKRGYYDFIRVTLAVLVSSVALSLFLCDALNRFELTTFDYRMKLRRPRAANEKIVFVDMGEDSIKKIGRWPWPREWHATLVEILSRFKADAIVFDVIFSESASDFSDSALEEAMKKSGKVYLPSALELTDFDEKEKSWNIRNLISPLERFSIWDNGKAHITIVPDTDGSIRRIPLFIRHQGQVYPQMGFRVASGVMGTNPEEYEIIKTPFNQYAKIEKNKDKSLYIPIDNKNQVIVNWVAKWGKGFKHYSFVDVITSYQNIMQEKEPIIDLKVFEDKICLIGLTASGLYDVKPNPLQPAYPAVGANASIVNSILNEDFVKKVPLWLDAFIILFLGIFLSVIVSMVQPVKGMLVALSMMVAYILIAFFMLDLFNIWVVLIYPLLTILFTYLVITIYTQIIISIERTKLFTLATKDGLTGLYVIRHFKLLLGAEMDMSREGKGKLSILMLDIDHFKKVNDTYGHQVGDFMLREVANILLSCCRQFDIPSRYGGEEFIIMLPGADSKEALMVAERIRKKIENNVFKLGDKTYRATVSLGVASFLGETAIDNFVKRADDALYKSKEAGRNKVTLS